jgi:hypothetical protein
MPINRERIREHLRSFEFKRLLNASNWGQVNAKPAPIANLPWLQQPIAEMNGVRVYEIFPAEGQAPLPDAKQRAVIHNHIEHQQARENLLIFCDAREPQQRTQSLWYWVKRDGGKKLAREHQYFKGQPGDLFLTKLDGLFIDMDELRDDGTIPLVEAIGKLSAAMDVERVTKKFYSEFSALRIEFIDLIEGIEREADRFWYASVLLNRLMFVYFMQKRGFIQRNLHYLDDKLQASKGRGANLYYAEFLNALFFEGFAKPEAQRSPEAKALLGPIRYLNGGLFIRHKLEIEYPNIRIPDRAFENVLNLFGSYSWHLDDTPGADDNEINPDVLGYIFEKYINQKAFGAYYTRPEITQYLCERTIHAVILDRIHEHSTRRFDDISEVLLKLDAELCRLLLFTVLPKISILDPACGSGAFLVAAMKTLLDLYAAVYGKIRFLNDLNLSAHLKEIDDRHPSLNYYVRKRVITDNLFGVDIMEEAAEIAKLRLFLVLVSSAQTVNQLEPLPNIDFNIMTGNSLIGLLTVDEQRFDDKSQMPDMFQQSKAQAYRSVLAEKNRLIDSYRHASNLTDDLQALRDRIDRHKADAYAALDPILLDDFRALGIRYEQAQADGKAKKRPLELADVLALNPFHWGYEFDDILAQRGGFDVIITNPPWEIFKPQAKEFFAQYSDLVTKNKMTIKEFEQQQEQMLQEPEIQAAWLEYLSSYPYVSAYYRSAPQYANQISIVSGKKAGSDINLYKLFTEQCINLLRPGGQCGIVIPSGIYTDLGTKQLRELLFSRTTITGLFGFENRKEIFEGVDSRFKFVVLTLARAGSTQAFPAAFMRHEVRELEDFPKADSLLMRVETIRRMSPDSLSIPEYKNAMDVQIAEKMSVHPLLGEDLPNTWNLKLGTEFHMTNDSDLFRTQPGPGRLPLYEGKMIHQFTHRWEGAAARYWIDEQEGRKRIIGARGKDVGQKLDYQTYRLGFRDIARNTDTRTMISTITPKSFHGNKLPCVVTLGENGERRIDEATQVFLCAIWNSFPLDYLIRQRVTSTLNFFYVYQLPVPRLSAGERYFDAIVERAAKLICTTPEFDDLARAVGLGGHQTGVTDEAGRARLRADLDGMIAHLYGLTEDEFAYILSTFPLVSEAVKAAALDAYRALA